jgi:hypothetical protein
MREWASNQRIVTPVTYVIRGRRIHPPEADESAEKKYKKLGF